MPALAKPCLEPGCTRITRAGSRCPEHQRVSPSRRGYDYQWQQQRQEAIYAHPWCVDCGTPGSPDNPLTGDHVVPLSKGGSVADGIAVRCRRCNSAKRDRL